MLRAATAEQKDNDWDDSSSVGLVCRRQRWLPPGVISTGVGTEIQHVLTANSTLF
jgi:hypothetical protein